MVFRGDEEETKKQLGLCGLPGYCGLVEIEEHLGVKIELWPQFRIGGSLWPSGKLLGQFMIEKHIAT